MKARMNKKVLAAVMGALLWSGAASAQEDAAETGDATAQGEAAAQESDGWRESITSAFSVKVPSDWVQRQSKLQRDGRGLGRWGYRSPSGGFKLQVNLERDDGKRTFEGKAQAVQRRTWMAYENVRIVESKTFTVAKAKGGERKVHTVIFRGDPKGRKGERRLVFELFTRAAATHRFVTLRLAAADRRVEELTEVAEKITESFELHRR